MDNELMNEAVETAVDEVSKATKHANLKTAGTITIFALAGYGALNLILAGVKVGKKWIAKNCKDSDVVEVDPGDVVVLDFDTKNDEEKKDK